jgi:hypothetical protein
MPVKSKSWWFKAYNHLFSKHLSISANLMETSKVNMELQNQLLRPNNKGPKNF